MNYVNNWDGRPRIQSYCLRGNGTLVIGAYIGFSELMQAGIINHMPKLMGIQASNCAPLWSQQQGLDFEAVHAKETIAEGIAIAVARRAPQIMNMISQTGGRFLVVEEGEIREALADMCRKGLYIEPTSAAVVAGAANYVRHYAQKDEIIVSVFTGQGLKASAKIGKLL